MNKPLVSIIIPVFNRAHLIGETLDSIISQTYKNWECIVVDDGSIDATVKVVQKYCDIDARFKLFNRPASRPKGGNAARNYGFEQCNGEFVNWFDSDDLMEPTFIEDKLMILLNIPNLDFVVSKSIKFFSNGLTEEIGYYKHNSAFELNADNFIQEKVHWLTPDILFKKNNVGSIAFDENLFSGQEYNFIIQILAFERLNGVFFNKTLANIRKHEDSIQELQKLNEFTAYKNKYKTTIKTFDEVYESINETSKVFFINRILKLTNPLLLNKIVPRSYLKFLFLYLKKCGFVKGTVLLMHSLLMLFGINSYKLRKMVIAK